MDQELLVGGAETNMTVIEWIMQELVSHPDKIAKVKAELKSVMGDEKVLDESKISKLPYLQAVVKESLRLHPPAAMLVPRKAESDQVVNGYLIPKGTQVDTNSYSTLSNFLYKSILSPSLKSGLYLPFWDVL